MFPEHVHPTKDTLHVRGRSEITKQYESTEAVRRLPAFLDVARQQLALTIMSFVIHGSGPGTSGKPRKRHRSCPHPRVR